MKQRDLERVAACIRKSCAEEFNNGLAPGIAALNRCLVWLRNNDKLVEPYTMEQLAEFVEKDLEDLKSRQKEIPNV